MDLDQARERMVREQLAARRITDERVLDAMRRIRREQFLPPEYGVEAYDDRPLPIGEGQTISQPYMVALMTQALRLESGNHVLEIGTGSGYQTAILSLLARDVISIERHERLAAAARGVLGAVGITNVQIIVADGTEGWPDGAPYDRILVTAGAPSIPEPLRDQLAPGGRLVIPVGPPGLQHVTIVDRSDDGFRTTTGEACVFVPLVGRQGWPG